MKTLVIIAVTVGIVASLFIWTSCAQSDNAQKDTGENHVKWVTKCLMDFDSIKPGMTREEIAKRFPMDGGLQAVSSVRFTHPSCRYFKMDVEFDFKRDATDQNRAIKRKNDKVTKVSKPYIERPYID